jgi:phosphatidylglycerophosphate synthase
VTVQARGAVIYAGLAATLALAVAAFALYLHTRSTPVEFSEPRAADVAFGAVAVAFAAVGTLILRAQPANPIGWLFWAVGLSTAIAAFAQQYAVYAVVGRTQPIWGGAAAAGCSRGAS